MKVDVFIPCFIDQFYPETAFNMINILEKAGCEVQYNPEQTCCGQPAFNSGYWKEAKKLAVKFFDDFKGENVIVTPSASCSGYVKNNFHKLFENESEAIEKSRVTGKRMFEFSDFLVNELQVIDVNSTFPHKVTFHDSCAGLREYGIKTEPRILLEKVKEIEVVEMENLDTCCGFGGTFSAKFHHISTAMTEQKVENALKTGAEYIVSTEASCLMNMEAYIKKNAINIRTIHLVDVLAKGPN